MKPLRREITTTDEWTILILFGKGFDTYTIALWFSTQDVQVHESEIANLLARLRDRQRQMVGGGNRA